MSVSISPTPRKQYLDANGNPAVGYKLFFYAAGSATKQTTYSDSAGATSNTNPIILDSEGRTPLAVWFTDGLAYKEVLAPSTDTDPPTSGVLMGDNLRGSSASVSTQSEWVAQSLTPTYISTSSFSVLGDQTGTFEVGRRVLCACSGGTRYGFIKSSVYTSLTTVTVQLDSGFLDSGLSAVSLGLLSVTNPSIPNSARVLNPSNAIINGKFSVAQKAATFAAVASGSYDLDGWVNYFTSAAVMTIAQDTGSVPTGEIYSRKVTFTTADTSIATGDYIIQQTLIEGYNCNEFLNNTFTLGFWVRSSVTGIHCVAFYNGTSTYVSEYTIDAANTWEYKSVTVFGGTPALNSTTNAFGLAISFANMCGTSGQITAGNWQAGNYKASANQVNDAGTINNTFYQAGVTITPGTLAIAPPFNYGDELRRCQRYYQKHFFNESHYGSAGASMITTRSFPVKMSSATPTIQALGSITYGNASNLTMAITANVEGVTYTYTATGAGMASASGVIEYLSRL